MRLIVPDQPKAQTLRTLKELDYAFTSLLSDPEANPKIAKNGTLGVLSSPLHLAPAKSSGFQVCPKATEPCIKACLNTAGNPMYLDAKLKARKSRTLAYFQHRHLFMALLIPEILSLSKKAHKKGMTTGVRLNATSDIPWERVSFTYKGVKWNNLMELFPHVSFYDYTKRPNRVNLPDNYSLTFSLSESNDLEALQALENGHNIAVVFNTKRGKPLPNVFNLRGKQVRVIDGDEHDYRPSDPKGVIVGLRAKGDAIGDTSGFVRDASKEEIDPPSLDFREHNILNEFDQYWEETCV